jgi:hypothetical protein
MSTGAKKSSFFDADERVAIEDALRVMSTDTTYIQL